MADDLEKYGKKVNSQISLDEAVNTYSNLSGKSIKQTFVGLTPYYPAPNDNDYSIGFIYRQFVVRYDGSITEVSKEEGGRKKGLLPTGLYYYVIIKWRITDSIVAPAGYTSQQVTTPRVNAFYIREGVKYLPSPLQRTFTNYFYNLEAFKLSS